MSALSYKEFMDAVKDRLARLSRDELLNIFVHRAEQTPAAKRREFLHELTAPGRKAEAVAAATLLEEIEAFAARVENGDYVEGWGWDEDICDERDWGDESWAEEMDGLFVQAGSLLLQGEHRVAEMAYKQLFDILAMGEEPGHLPGNPDSGSMLKADLGEQAALYLRAIYVNAAAADRPALLFEAMNEYAHFADRRLKLQHVIGAADSPLPDLNRFLGEWIDWLIRQEGMHVGEWLREAVWLQGGVPALSDFARRHADRYPKAYADWIGALEQEAVGDEAIVEAAREGLAAIPRDYAARADVAEALARVGERRGDLALKLEGYRERLYSRPTIRHLLDLYVAAQESGRWVEMREFAEQRIMALRRPEDRPATAGRHDYPEREVSSVSEGLVCHALLLGGRYDRAIDLCKHTNPLGWSDPEHPQPAVLAFVMVFLAKTGHSLGAVTREWEAAIGKAGYEMDAAYVAKYKQAARIATESVPFDAEQEARCLEWCGHEVGRRVDAIVSNQHRGSYYKAAGLLVAMAEVLAGRGQRTEGMKLIEAYRNKYPRHSSFKSDLAASLKASGLK